MEPIDFTLIVKLDAITLGLYLILNISSTVFPRTSAVLALAQKEPFSGEIPFT
jgi:hypothetical protein